MSNSMWRKSTYSGGATSNCIEVGTDDAVVVRDTKQAGQRDRTVVTFTPEAWQRFTRSIK
jgi:hypothetical protein